MGPGAAEAGGGHPPGSDKWTMDQIDHAGTWLKRPPNDYEPTRFENVWVPNETLLEQWVRQNIREVSIPIPGTTKKLHCVVSLLQLGGGCGITDPNMGRFGLSLNVMSLGGLALATGLVVDDSIVVLESIAKARERGLGILDAAVAGTREVSMRISVAAIIFSHTLGTPRKSVGWTSRRSSTKDSPPLPKFTT